MVVSSMNSNKKAPFSGAKSIYHVIVGGGVDECSLEHQWNINGTSMEQLAVRVFSSKTAFKSFNQCF